MPRFMVMILEKEVEERALAPTATRALVEGHSAYEGRLRAVSAYLDGEQLRPSSEGRRVSSRDGQPRVDAGPFADRALSGYYVLEAEGLDAAVLAALRRLPTRQREVIALRVFLDLDTQATAEVLGIAPGTVTAHLSRAATALRREPALRGLVVPSRADTTHDGGQQ